MSTSLQVLNEVRIAAPCTVSWRSMQGDERVRHCSHCDRKVFNLSQMSSADAAHLLEEHGHDLCVRLYKRRDGTVMTQDCGVSSRHRWRVAVWAASLVASLFATGCMGAVAVRPKDQQKCPPPATQPSEPGGAAAK
jgi:hypothetical protein